MYFRIFKLIKMLDNYGVSKASEYLQKNLTLGKIRNGELEQFINYYLSFNFEINNKYPFVILYLINDSEYLKHSDVINTNYFNTMPSSFAFQFLKNHQHGIDKDFVNYLISKLDEDDIKHISCELVFGAYSSLRECHLPALITKLKEHHNIDNFYLLYCELKKMRMDFIALLINDYSEEDIKSFALKFDRFNEIEVLIYQLIDASRVREALNIIIELSNKNEKKEQSALDFCLDAVDKKKVFVAFAENANEEGKEYITRVEEEIINTDNYELMYYWFITEDGANNKKYEMLDKFINKGVYLGKLLLTLQPKYKKYLIDKSSELNKLNILINDLLANISNNTITEIDKVLELILSIKPDYKLSKCASITLLGYNTKHYRLLLNNYEYTQEERLQLLENLNLNGNYNLIAIYGSYYLTGNRNMIVSESIIKESTQVLRLLRSTNL